jgi:Na+-transporting NADH:ubiquinone oxidoreductase subunit NqrE
MYRNFYFDSMILPPLPFCPEFRTGNAIKYYVFVTISFLVAVSFHASVYHRFGLMEKDLNKAARIKFTMEMDEMKALHNYLQSVEFHRRGIQDTVRAYEYAYDAEYLRESVVEEGADVQRLKEEAKEKEHEAKVDMRKSGIYGMSSFRDSRASVEETVAGVNLAMQAKEENERSEVIMNRTAEEEARGKKKLREAQAALDVAEAAQNQTKLDSGICKWATVVCDAVRTDQNQTASVTASDEVIKANRDIRNALQVIHDAEQQRSEAIELHKMASYHANLSTAILRDAQAFKDQADEYRKNAEEYRVIASWEVAEAMKDEVTAEQEENDIKLKQMEMINDTEHSMSLIERVITDRYREEYALEKMNKDLEFVKKRRAQWEEEKEEATLHVAKAGWEALVASLSGLCMLVLVATRIIATFRYQRPLRWILREPPYFSQDLWYLVCHLCIFVLAMGYVGELLMTFHYQSNTARTGITIIFALSAAVLQVTMLHVLPSVHKLFQESGIDANAVRLFVVQVVIQKGAIIAIVSAIEMLLCWCWMGTLAFTRVHKLNNYLVWLVVLCVSFGYGIFLRTREYAIADYVPASCGTGLEVPSNATNNDDKYDERNSLLAPSFAGSSQGSVSTVTNTMGVASNAEAPASMRSVEMGDSLYDNDDYGSLSNIFRSHLSTSPMKFSWKSELEKTRLLFEFWMVSLALWIVRRDLALIRKLSPLSTELVWGQVPLWILNSCLIILFVTLIVSFSNMKFGR